MGGGAAPKDDRVSPIGPSGVAERAFGRCSEADASGLVDIARFTGRISGAGDCIFARTTITSGNERTMNLKFGYSDAISIYLNGQIEFFGNSGYRQRDPSFLGIIGLHDAVYLPLKKGPNELLLIVAESFRFFIRINSP